MTNLHQELRETFEAYQSLTRVERHLTQLNEQLVSANKDLDHLEKQLRKEFQDIEKTGKTQCERAFSSSIGK